MQKKIFNVVFIVLLLNGCGGSGSSDNPDKDNDVPLGSKKDISEYFRGNFSTAEFYLTEYYFNDGTPAWFNAIGDSVAEPTTDAEQLIAFNKIKTINTNIVDIYQTQTKFEPSLGDDPNGPFNFADRASIFNVVENNEFVQFRESTENNNFSDFTILDKYNFNIPQLYNTNDSLVLNSSNSSRINTYENCSIVFGDVINLTNITPLASGVYSDTLTVDCAIYSASNDAELGYRKSYYSKGVGLVHRTTSLGQGVVQHVIKNRIEIN